MTTRPDPTSELERLIAAEAAVAPSAATRAANWAGLHARLAAAPASAATAGSSSGLVKLLVVAAVAGAAIAAVALAPRSPAPVTAPAAAAGPAAPERAAPEPPVLEDMPSPPAEHGDGSWDPELVHLQRVHAALRAGRPADARALVDEYGERWPDGVFIEEIEAARVLAACATARDAAARRTLAAFLRRWPESLYGARVRRSCDRP